MLAESNHTTLPFSRFEDMKKPRWSFLYAHNLRTIRDTFVYCTLEERIKEEDLYRVMKEERIPPPRNRWIYPHPKRKERLRLEYVHAARYLGLIRKDGNFLVPDFSCLKKEKKTIVKENQTRLFKPSKYSPTLTIAEKEALLKIVLEYERARDFLWWFLDFIQFPSMSSFDENDFRKHARSIFILGKIEKGKKGSTILKREIDGEIWRIPEGKPYDYTRLASFIFPTWFKDLGLIDEAIVFPEFSEDRNLWHMYYPIKMSEEQFLELDLSVILESLLSKQKGRSIWTPYLLYVMARKYNSSTQAIKTGIENTYKKHAGRFYLERAPSHLVKRRYKDSYIEIGGFLRSYMNLSKVIDNE